MMIHSVGYRKYCRVFFFFFFLQLFISFCHFNIKFEFYYSREKQFTG